MTSHVSSRGNADGGMFRARKIRRALILAAFLTLLVQLLWHPFRRAHEGSILVGIKVSMQKPDLGPANGFEEVLLCCGAAVLLCAPDDFRATAAASPSSRNSCTTSMDRPRHRHV